MPVHVYRKTTSNGKTKKELQPNHPVERLLNRPNDWQAKENYWTDAVSALLRHGNYYAYVARGATGPIRRLLPLNPGQTEPKQDDAWNVMYETVQRGGRKQELQPWEVHHVRMTARNSLKGDSPVMDVREAIALEIAAEKMGASLFGNGAMPGMVFKYADGSQGHKTDVERTAFLEDIGKAFTGRGRFKAMLLPKGIDVGQQIAVENEKAQFLELRQYQRTVIAGAFGCPIHLVGDLTKGTFNNVEMQGIEFVTNVILPLIRLFEGAMERDLLTDQDRRGGVIIRFNPDAMLRGDFKSRQEGLAIQRQNGVINANEWREREDMNPREDEGGDSYYETGPSGQTPSTGMRDGSGDADPEIDEDAA